jgi:hypothetical protein
MVARTADRLSPPEGKFGDGRDLDTASGELSLREADETRPQAYRRDLSRREGGGTERERALIGCGIAEVGEVEASERAGGVLILGRVRRHRASG